MLCAANLSPSLEVLPLNSTLSNVTIPRYDENQNRVAYLKADLMEILADGEPINDRQPIMVDCTGIQLRMAYDAVDGEISVDMKNARYRVTPGVLTVQETIIAHSPRFHITGSGGVFHLDSRRGFIFGPVDCEIYPKQIAYQPTMLHPIHALMATTGLAALNPGYNPPSAEELLKVDKLVAMNSGYNAPAAEDLLKVERLAKPLKAKMQARQKELADSASEKQAVSDEASKTLSQFAEDVDSDSLNLLIQNPPAAKPALAAKPPIVDPEFTINCDGGCFFDGDENLLVLLRNVVVKEARFTLKAQEEIKVFFIAAPEEEKKAGDEKKDQAAGPRISDVKNLVASGGVNFSGIDKNGNPVEASAATAFYDDKDKVLILKDGNPTFYTKTGENELHLRANKAGASVRIELAGQAMNAQTSPDGWTLGAKKLPLKEN